MNSISVKAAMGRAVIARWVFAVCCTVTAGMLPAMALAQKEIVIGSGTQHTTTNTVTGGIVIKELGLMEKYLPKTGQYKDVKFKIDWQNFTSGPPITNGMMADKIHIGMMGDYPLLVNGATGQQTRNETLLVAIIAYNQYGGGEVFHYIPCLNDDALWISALGDLAQQHLAGWPTLTAPDAQALAASRAEALALGAAD